MTGRKKFFCLILFIILLTSCTTVKNTLAPANTAYVIDQSILDTYHDLSDKNIAWLSREGWFHYTATPTNSDINRFTRHDQWFQVDNNGNVLEELYCVTNAEQSVEYQRLVKNIQGWRAELIELRNKGNDAFDYARPKMMNNYTITSMSRVTSDFDDLQNNSEYITNIYSSEEIVGDQNLVTIHVEYIGNPEVKRLGILDGKKGKIEEFVYDQLTGQRVAYRRTFLNTDNTLDNTASLSELVQFYQSPPADVLDEYLESEKELEFYVEVISE